MAGTPDIPPSDEVASWEQARTASACGDCPGCRINAIVDEAIAGWSVRDRVRLLNVVVAEGERLAASIQADRE